MCESYIKDVIYNNYGILPQSVEKIKNVYKVLSNNKYYCFKVIKYNFGHFLFIISAMKYLQDKEFNKIPEFILTKEGKYYVNVGVNHGYLTPWINARHCDYDNLKDVETATLKLAELHVKSRGFEATMHMNPRIGWLMWINTYKTRINEILDFKSRIDQKENKEEFDFKYLKIMDEELERAYKSVRHLQKSAYVDVMKEQITNKGFCHHDFANHNILIDDKNEIYIIDFDYCILDTNLHDLSSLMIRVMKNKKWSLDKARYILDSYDSINKIESRYIPIMAAFMEFPQEYWQLGIQYYWENQPWKEKVFLNKLNKIYEDRQERQEFVDEFRKLKK